MMKIGYMQNGNTDMYREILKEIGAEESIMEYLFDDSSGDEADTDDFTVHDELKTSSNIMTYSDPSLSLDESSSDEKLLYQNESEALSDNVGESSIDSHNYDHNSGPKEPGVLVPDWKQMMHHASIQQDDLMAQMTKVQNIQKESSPSKQRGISGDEKKEIFETYKCTPQGFAASPVLHEISLRNAKLQEEWQSQKKQTLELQDKLSALQSQFHDQKKQWDNEKQELFSPIRSPTRIPRWDSTSTKPSPKVMLERTRLSPLSQHHSTTTGVTNDVMSKADKAIDNSDVSITLLNRRDEKIRELEDQLRESQKLNAEQQTDLDDTKDRLKKTTGDFRALLRQYETEQKEWKDSKHQMEAIHRKEKETWMKDLEAANDLLQKQVTLNQEQRQELQELKLSSWKNELEDTRNHIKSAIMQQTKKSDDFQVRIAELEKRHEEERQDWKTRLEGYKKQLEENAIGWESSLDDANLRYAQLKAKYLKETREWQDLLEADMDKAIDESTHVEENQMFRSPGNGEISEMLSPDPQDSSAGQSSKDSSLLVSPYPMEIAPSQSFEKIDTLIEEFSLMDAERIAILREINRGNDLGGYKSWGSEQANPDLSNMDSNHQTEKSSKVKKSLVAVNTPESTPRDDRRESFNALDTTGDSSVLDQTLNLLNNLKDLMANNGDINEKETAVLEHLEVLSELLHDQSDCQSMISSPRRVSEQEHSRYLNHDTSLDVSRDDSFQDLTMGRKDSTWIVSMQAIMDPCQALVAELKCRCEFLEQDRRELALITEEIIKRERESHRAEIDANVAICRRESNEKLHKLEQDHNRQRRAFYHNLCYNCQQRIYSML